MANDRRKQQKTEKESSKMQLSGKKIQGFFAGLRTELKKVIWPSKKTLKETTLAVLAISLGVAILVFVVDQLMLGILNLAGFNKPKEVKHLDPVPAQTETISKEDATSTSSNQVETTSSASSTTSKDK